MAHLKITPRPASTLILTRDSACGLEVFLMQRTHQAVFMPGYFVFPGGMVDALDASASMLSFCSDFADSEAKAMLGLEQGGLAYVIAAIRESFEEVGLLLAQDAAGDYIEIAEPGDVEYYAGLRERLNAGQLTFADVFRSRGLNAAVEKLVFSVVGSRRSDYPVVMIRIFLLPQPQNDRPLWRMVKKPLIIFG